MTILGTEYTLSRFVRSSVVIAGFLLFFESCAVQEMPEGGPPDTTPPRIAETYPANYTTHYADDHIVLEFDKYVDQRAVEESIFISPYVGDLDFDWSGKEVDVRFSGHLRLNTTYVVNVGTDVKDIRGNKMAQAFSLAFSTGPDIDHGAIVGRILTMKPTDDPQGVMIFAYGLKGLNADTLNPNTLKPDYITQTGKDGSFFLYHLAFGTYRVFAVRDAYRNLLYDPEADEYGVCSRDLNLTQEDTLVGKIVLPLAKEDTTAPRLIKAEARDQHHLLVEFSEDLDTSMVPTFVSTIVDTTTQTPLNVLGVYTNFPKLSSFTVVTGTQDSTARYRLTATSCRDIAGNGISLTANSLTFGGSGKRDTLGIHQISFSLKDSVRNVDLQPRITISFSDALAGKNRSVSVTLQNNVKHEIDLRTRWLSDAALLVQPIRLLAGMTWHALEIDGGRSTDLFGRRPKDSVKVLRFETLDAEDLSSIDGIVTDLNTTDTVGTVFVTAANAAQKDATKYVTRIDSNGAFIFPMVVEGKYVLQAFRDRNRNGVFDPGKTFPFVPSERITPWTDTLKVRARWPLEGVRIDLR